MQLSHTSASCHSSRYHQQSIPEPYPTSLGIICRGMPLFSTKKMPISAVRASMRDLST